MAEYKTMERLGVLVIRCPTNVVVEDPKSMQVQIKTWLLSPRSVHVLELKLVTAFDPDFCKGLVNYIQTLRKHDKAFFILNASPEVSRKIADKGLQKLFNPIGSFDEASQLARRLDQLAEAMLDTETISALTLSMNAALEKKLEFKSSIEKPVVKMAEERAASDLGGLLLMSFAGVEYGVFICLQAAHYMLLFNRNSDQKPGEHNAEVELGLRELLSAFYAELEVIVGKQPAASQVRIERKATEVFIGSKLKAQPLREKAFTSVVFSNTTGAFQLEIVRVVEGKT